MGQRPTKQQRTAVATERLVLLLEGKVQAEDWDETELLLHQIPEDETLPNIYLGIEPRHTILHLAVSKEAPVRVLEKLLAVIDKEFCFQAEVPTGSTPLHCLIKHRTIDVASLRLLAQAFPESLNAPDQNSGGPKTPLDLLMTSDLSKERRAELLTMMLEIYPDALYFVDNNGQNLLHRAMEFMYNESQFHTSEVLVAAKPKLVEERDVNGKTPIHRAVQWCESEYDQLLRLMQTVIATNRLDILQNIAEAHRFHFDSFPPPPQWVAAYRAHIAEAPRDTIETLIRARPNAVTTEDENGHTPLMIFCNQWAPILMENDYEMLHTYEIAEEVTEKAMMLLTGRPHRMSEPPSLTTLLRHEKCTPDIANLFIHMLKSQLSIPDEVGNLPLHVIASFQPSSNGCAVGLEAMLKLYPDACRVPGSGGTLPLEVMCHSGHCWLSGMRQVLLAYPAAVVDLGLNRHAFCALLERVGNDPDTRFQLLQEARLWFQNRL